MADEHPLVGGRITEGVVRVGDTVRRPAQRNSPFVRDLLRTLHNRGFDGAPRYLGRDERGREVFSYLPGVVPADLDPRISDETLIEAAHLIRRCHDATAGTEIAGDQEVVCHNDLSPCNFVFRDERPIGIIDFDAAAPGQRIADIGYALFLWLNIGSGGAPLAEQARRITVFCDSYGAVADRDVVEAIVAAVAANVERLRAAERARDVNWWAGQLGWLRSQRDRLVHQLSS